MQQTLGPCRCNDRILIRLICIVNARYKVTCSPDTLLSKLGIRDLDVVIFTSRMRWFGLEGWIDEVRKPDVVTQKRSDRPTKTLGEVLEDDKKKLEMDFADPHNCSEWRVRLRGRLVRQAQPPVVDNKL